MSVRLFHRGARLVIRRRRVAGSAHWHAIHRRPVAWENIFGAALSLIGHRAVPDTHGLAFGDGGAVHWTRGAMWTTIRLRLPPCSAKKAELLEAGLLKAARYAETTGVPHAERQ